MAFTMLLLAAGCALQQPAQAPHEEDLRRASRAAREAAMNQRWRHRTMGELIRTEGPPRLFLDIPGGGSPPGFVMVYPRDAGTGCLDTFALVLGREPVIRAYQCR